MPDRQDDATGAHALCSCSCCPKHPAHGTGSREPVLVECCRLFGEFVECAEFERVAPEAAALSAERARDNIRAMKEAGW